MNVIFYLEPAIEMGNPEFRYATLRSSIVPQVAALRGAGVNTHTILSEVVAERALRDGHINALSSVSTIDPLSWTECENTLRRSLRHQSKEYKKGEQKRLGDLLKKGIPQGFEPDIILVWESPMTFFEDAFPKARIIYQMPGFFSRAPFASLVSFDVGLLGDSTSPCTRSVSVAEIEALDSLREHEARFLGSINPTKTEIDVLRQRFSSLILFPLQVDGYFMIDSVLGGRSQFDALLEIMSHIPADQALVVTNYWSGQTRSAVLTGQNIAYLRSRFNNFAYFEEFDKIPSVSQFLVPEVDGVVTISSSVGYQAAFWRKPLITLGDSHITPFQTANDWSEFLVQVAAGMPLVRDVLIISTISTRHLPAQMLSEDGKGYANWLHEVKDSPEGEFPRWTNEKLVGKTLYDLRQEADFLKQLNYFDRVREESSMEHCRELSQQIPRYPIVSFDVFDTLLYRPFKTPSDMFDFMSEEVRVIVDQPSLDFRVARRESEKKAFDAAIARGQGECTIDEIYDYFADQIRIGREAVERVKQLEMQMEFDLLYPRKSGFKAFNEARSLGKRIIIISDMYLPRDFIEKVLKKNGYVGYDRFYLSSELRRKKHNGRLFDRILKDLKVDPGTILHIGDNVTADVIRAKERGIKPFHLLKASEIFAECDAFKGLWLRDQERHSLDWKMVLAIAGNRFHDNPYLPHRRGTLFCGDPWRLGYYGQGPLLLGYTKWLIEKSIRDGVKRLYFLSRDGLIMKEAYDRIAKKYPEAPSSHYLLCSRRAVNLAKVRDAHGIMDLLHVDYARTTIQHLLTSRFGIYPQHIPIDVLFKHGLTLETIVSNKDEELLKPLLLDLMSLIVKTAGEERANYLEYLKGTGLLDGGKVALVDIGYAGTMQESLYLLTDRQKKFSGYYLITFRQALKRVAAYGMEISGYLGEFVDRHDTHNPFCRNVPLYETLFSSVETSFVRMDRDWNGRLTPIFMDRVAAEAKREAVVHRVHLGALSFIDEAADILGRHLTKMDIEPFKSLRVLEKFFREPHPVDARMFAGLVFEDFYGGAGLKIILPGEENMSVNCVWRVGAEVLIDGNKKNESQSLEINCTTASSIPPGRLSKNLIRADRHFIGWVLKKITSDRKLRKFERSPGAFFLDSKFASVRLVGKILNYRNGEDR